MGITNFFKAIQDIENNFLLNSATKFYKKQIEDNQRISEIYIKILIPFFNKRGWYISGELYNEQIVSLAKAIKDIGKNGDEQQEYKIEEALMEFVKHQLMKKESEIYTTWPHRAEILKTTISAHKESNYILCIPVLLAQSDGICHDMFGLHIFTQKRGKSLSERIGEIKNSKINTSLMKAFLELLSNPSSITANTKTREERQRADKLYGPINRHGILHGIDLNYNSEANSLRCISLLFFLKFLQNSYLMDKL
ncbi:hypothetical protein [Legionella gresilensis]|uniref:hypothetical protein n=1 Tax=Legionella gresilensis TaxID=91823 RepID=UPI001041994E|nr:hypothetical protein [Legionella gresilensis]